MFHNMLCYITYLIVMFMLCYITCYVYVILHNMLCLCYVL